MFDGIRGVKQGNKVATASAALCQECINILRKNGIEIKLPTLTRKSEQHAH